MVIINTVGNKMHLCSAFLSSVVVSLGDACVLLLLLFRLFSLSLEPKMIDQCWFQEEMQKETLYRIRFFIRFNEWYSIQIMKAKLKIITSETWQIEINMQWEFDTQNDRLAHILTFVPTLYIYGALKLISKSHSNIITKIFDN